jgi:hypothetical protein
MGNEILGQMAMSAISKIGKTDARLEIVHTNPGCYRILGFVITPYPAICYIQSEHSLTIISINASVGRVIKLVDNSFSNKGTYFSFTSIRVWIGNIAGVAYQSE